MGVVTARMMCMHCLSKRARQHIDPRRDACEGHTSVAATPVQVVQSSACGDVSARWVRE